MESSADLAGSRRGSQDREEERRRLSVAKRKGASFPPADGAAGAADGRSCKRRAMAGEGELYRDWAALHPDLTGLIASRLLAADVTDYMSFRAACAPWRASTASPRDANLRDARFRPRGWVALCDGDGVRPADACEIPFFHTATGKRLRARLPELRGHRIVGFTDGLLILLNKATAAVRVLHPFTRAVVDLPSLAPVLTDLATDLESRAWMRAAVCSSHTTNSIAVVVWFPTNPAVVYAEHGHATRAHWVIMYRNLTLAAAAPFHGRLYGIRSVSRKVVQVYPPCPNPVAACIPNEFGIRGLHVFFLVESASRLMAVLRHCCKSNLIKGWHPCLFELFEVDTAGHGGLTPVSSLGDQALFLTPECCLSVSQNNLPSISGNTIYFSALDFNPIIQYSVSSRTCERTSALSVIHDFKKRIRPSVRPFALADHLLTYCYRRHWTRGLMFHEYHSLPVSWKKLARKLIDQDNEVQVSSLGVSSSRAMSSTPETNGHIIIAQRITAHHQLA